MAETKLSPADNSTDVVSLDSLAKPKEFPYSDADKLRLDDYNFFRRLFEGAHFEAFRIKIKDDDFNKAYAKLRYVYINFAGMISRLCADMLFGEPVRPKVEDPEIQAWLEDLWRENGMNVLNYESALDSSSFGDILFKARVGSRRPGSKEPAVLIEQTPPTIYFPHVDGFNVSAEPNIKELAWVFERDGKKYLRRELHSPGFILNRVYLMEGNKIGNEVSLAEAGLGNLPNAESTRIDRHILMHSPNWKTGIRHFGFSDYHDLDAIFYAINNRMSMVDNVLDKHTDPILMVPPGIIDPKTGKVRKDKRVIEMGEGEDGKPEYIVWDASLENAINQIDKLVEVMWMVGEVSPDAFGMGKGQSDSGRALKFKLLRTIAKASRKKLYFDKNLKEALYVAQLLSKAWGAEVNGKAFKWEPVVPELVWQDGLPTDEVELVDTEVKKVDAGLTTQKKSIMKIHEVDEETAEKMVKEVNEEKKVKMPTPLDPGRNPFLKKPPKKPPVGGPPVPPKK